MSEVALKAKEYRSDVKPVWCVGCGDYGELSAFTQALSNLHIQPEKMVIASGIGCSGRFSHFVKCYAFHTAHGRALPAAIGVKAANPDLTVFSVGGDGDGLGIGGGHIPHAARKNADLTYIISDNGIYGLTKGQSSPTTPINRVTTTAPFGMVERPLDPVRMFLAYGITFVALGFTYDVKGLTHILTEAIKHKGFSIVHLLAPCVNYNITTADSLREVIAPIPDDHDRGDIKKAFQLALEDTKIYTGIFYQIDTPTLDDDVRELQARSKTRKPKDIRGIFEQFI
ncbi:MAG: 2-oxoacid:ferredoxin oxidoreductase subunit beta [Chitinivibrionia bacterium]|nr:2-oxoacid:ferredoxin oxidoreductase subunit beta [Chitinivibrionia bacterium]